MIHPTEDDLEEYRRQDREDKGIAHLEERRRREPPIGDPCERCGGSGAVYVWVTTTQGETEIREECPRCFGSGVQP